MKPLKRSYILLIAAFVAGLMFFIGQEAGYMSGKDDGYRSGQIDVMNEIIKYELVNHKNGERTWQRINP